MLHTEFQASEPSGSEEENFLILFYIYFYDLNLGPPGAGPSWTLRPPFYLTYLSQVILKKKIFEYFLCISMI